MAFLFVLPVAFLLVYSFDFVHPVSTLMIRDAMRADGYKREWIALSDASLSMPAGVIMSEDGKFCSYSGIDWDMFLQILKDDSGRWRGGSTVTMRMIKNLFLWSNWSYNRKFFEIPYSIIADFILSKKRIMEIYLNIVEWGLGIYGIEAASSYYFNESARNLTIQQVASLVASLPNPYKPTYHFLAVTQIIKKRISILGAYTRCIH